MRQVVFVLLFTLIPVVGAHAQDVRITTFKENSTFVLNGQTFTISRNQDTEAVLTGEFARTSRQCPPFCIQPFSVADGVETLGELEVLSFLENIVAAGDGLLIDSRVPEWFAKGSIPGAVNVPFVTLEDSNPYRDDILRALGATQTASGGLDFTNAMELALFCNGPWCEQSPRAIRDLLAAGYPADKLHYYRGGMQAWQQLGLTVSHQNTDG